MRFLDYFPGHVFQVFKDNPGANGYAQVFTKCDEVKFRKLNEQGLGIYFTPNAFSATDKERDELWGKRKVNKSDASRPTARNTEFLKKINAVYGDLDVAKEGEKVSPEMLQRLARGLLHDKPKPNFIIQTKNGLQPIWLIEEDGIDEETQAKAVNVMEGIIEWSKGFGAKGDKVKDVARVLRLPGYNHMKGDPFMCQARKYHDEKYTLDVLSEAFPYVEKKSVYVAPSSDYKKNDTSLEIDRLDFQELIIRAFAATGRTASFDNQKRLVLDGRLTGTHQGKTGDGEFLASNSHEPFVGNRITATADILGVTNKEARAWIVEEYGLGEVLKNKKKSKAKEVVAKVMSREDKDVEELLAELETPGPMFTWGTKMLDKYITPIENDHLIFLAGLTNAGKTAFAFDMAYKNAKNGKKILFLSLEMSRKQIYKRVARSYAGISKSQWRDKASITEEQKAAYTSRLHSMNDTKNMVLLGFRHDQSPTVEAIFEVIEQVDPDFTIVDNFDLIWKDPNVSEYMGQNMTVDALMAKCHDQKRPVLVLHHKNAKSAKQGLGSNRGSGKIGDGCDISLGCSRTWEKDAADIDNARFVLEHEKDRDFGEFNSVDVYFQNGTFSDEYEECGSSTHKKGEAFDKAVRAANLFP